MVFCLQDTTVLPISRVSAMDTVPVRRQMRQILSMPASVKADIQAMSVKRRSMSVTLTLVMPMVPALMILMPTHALAKTSTLVTIVKVSSHLFQENVEFASNLIHFMAICLANQNIKNGQYLHSTAVV